MMTSRVHLPALLDAIETNSVSRAELDRNEKQRLLDHPDAKIRQRCRRLFANEVASNRAQVVEQHQRVLELDGNVDRGQAVFKKHCATCHRVGDMGHQVAPELASVKNKSHADLLIAILDPSREAQPNFTAYNIATTDGRVHSGIIVAESANSLTLRRAEGKESVILRSSIDELLSSGKSLMPEGLEKDLTPQDLADVIEFVKRIGGQR